MTAEPFQVKYVYMAFSRVCGRLKSLFLLFSVFLPRMIFRFQPNDFLFGLDFHENVHISYADKPKTLFLRALFNIV